MKEKIKQLILAGNFFEAKASLNELEWGIVKDVLFMIGYSEKSLCANSFVCFLLLEKETIELHMLAIDLLVGNFACLIAGSYETAVYHARKAMQLNPDDIELGEALLFLNKFPEKPVSDEEAMLVAKKILEKNPSNEFAQEILFGDKKILELLEREKSTMNDE